MDVSEPRTEAVCDAPIHRTPVVGDENVGDDTL